MIEQKKRILILNLWLLDLVLTGASAYLAYRVRQLVDQAGYLEDRTVLPFHEYLWMLAVILPVWALFLPLFRVYSDTARPILDQIVVLTKAVVVAGLVALVVQFSISSSVFDRHRLIAVVTIVISYALMTSYRLIFFRLAARRGFDSRHVAVVGTGATALAFARKVEDAHGWGFKLAGVFSPQDISRALERGGIDEVIVVAGNEPLGELSDLMLLCEQLGVTTRLVLDFFPHSPARMELGNFGGLPLLSFSTTRTNEALLFVRRAMDLAIVCFAAAPALLIVAVSAALVRLTSPGPVFFSQKRCGLNGRVFTMYKLRSMVDNAEQLRVDLEVLNEMDGPVFKSSIDPRITPIGKLLRKFSIDELPQLLNVLRGDMSIVGPRPPLPQEVARYERWQRRRLSMKPGITCLWQISGRNKVGFQEWMKLDLKYIDNWSLLLDLKILIKTVPVVLLGRGAR